MSDAPAPHQLLLGFGALSAVADWRTRATIGYRRHLDSLHSIVARRIGLDRSVLDRRFEPYGSIGAPLMAGIDASRPLRRIPAIVSFLNPQPALSLAGGNRSSCPTPAVRDTRRDRRNWVVCRHSRRSPNGALTRPFKSGRVRLCTPAEFMQDRPTMMVTSTTQRVHALQERLITPVP